MDKAFLAEQLGARLRQSVHSTQKMVHEAAQDARSGADRAVNIAKGQLMRSERVRAELDALENFRPVSMGKGARVALGALVEIEGDDSGRTLFLAPAGAGLELTGPGGDGFFSVITPQSPIGRAMMGKRVGDSFDVTVNGEALAYTITWIG
jgi:transcription elongation GreA/GreB family factor